MLLLNLRKSQLTVVFVFANIFIIASSAKIAVSFLSGKRVSMNFPIFSTIYEIINEIASKNPGIEEDMWTNPEIAPAIIFVQREVFYFCFLFGSA